MFFSNFYGATTNLGNTGLTLFFGQDVTFNYDDGKLYTINCGVQHTYGTYECKASGGVFQYRGIVRVC